MKNSPQMGESLYGVCTNTDAAKKQKQISAAITVMMLRGLIAPAEVLMRRKFGERYFGGSVLIGNLLVIGIMAAIFPHAISLYFGSVFFILLMGMAYHQSVCYRRDRRGEYWHSYYDGTSWMRIPALERFVAHKRFVGDSAKVVVEPVALFLISWLILLPIPSGPMTSGNFAVYSPPAKFLIVLSIYFSIASIFLFIYQLVAWNIKKEALLDAKDAQVTAQQAMQASNASGRKRVSDYEGIVVQPAHDADGANWTQ